MGRALFLSEGFHQWLHAGGEKLSARSFHVPERRRGDPRRERGHGAVAQGFLREGRIELQAAGRSRRKNGRGLWVWDGIQRREDGRAEHFPDRSAGEDRKGLHVREAGGTQRAGIEGSRRAEEKSVARNRSGGLTALQRMSSQFLGLRTVIYHAPDLAKTKAWYAEALGIQPYFDQPFYVGFNVGGFELGLDPDACGTPGGKAGSVAYWGVANAEGAFRRLI